jgi:hypothetical protein
MKKFLLALLELVLLAGFVSFPMGPGGAPLMPLTAEGASKHGVASFSPSGTVADNAAFKIVFDEAIVAKDETGMTNGGGVDFTGDPGEDITAEQAKTASFWTRTANWSASVWTFEDGYFPLLKNVEGQTRRVPGEYDEDAGEEETDAETGSTVKPSGGHGGTSEDGNTGGEPVPEPESGGSNSVPVPETGSGDEPDPDSDPVPEPILGPSPAPNTEPVAVTVPDGGSLTLPPDTVVASATGVAILPAGGDVTLTDNKTKITVPKNTTVDPATGVITVPDGGDVTLEDWAIVITVPPATTIDSGSGTITVTSPEGGTVALPVELDGVEKSSVEVHVPSGSEIDAKTGVITLPDSGRIVFSVPNGEAGAYGTKTAAAYSGDLSELAFIVASGTTVSPTTGVMTVTNGGEVTFPDGSTVTVEPGATINPFTGEIIQPSAKGNEVEDKAETGGSGGGCDTGLGFAGLAIFAVLGIALAVKRGKPQNYSGLA